MYCPKVGSEGFCYGFSKGGRLCGMVRQREFDLLFGEQMSLSLPKKTKKSVFKDRRLVVVL